MRLRDGGEGAREGGASLSVCLAQLTFSAIPSQEHKRARPAALRVQRLLQQGSQKIVTTTNFARVVVVVVSEVSFCLAHGAGAGAAAHAPLPRCLRFCPRIGSRFTQKCTDGGGLPIDRVRKSPYFPYCCSLPQSLVSVCLAVRLSWLSALMPHLTPY